VSIVLLGELGGHARGKTLAAAVGAAPDDPPADGLALAFGKEAQQDGDQLTRWTTWAREPGRALVLLPPFQRGPCEIPTRWEARRAEALAGGGAGIAPALARERQHELRGDLVPLEIVAGQVITALWRRHPTAGLFVVTTLPLWSLVVLDHRTALRAWFDDLLGQAGTPRSLAESAAPPTFQPRPPDWTVLLHLCTGPYADDAAALDALAASALFRLDAKAARAALSRLEAAGWAEGGGINEAGHEALSRGPFSAQARALARMPHA